jgi:hypothetical protein
MDINIFLGHLNKVRKSKSGWMACCPNHEDNSPSLSINQGVDCILIHCVAGCDSGEVMDSIGLSLADLYRHKNDAKRRVMQWDKTILKSVVFHESIYIAMCENLAGSSRELTPMEISRLALAKRRLPKAMEVLNDC